MAATCKLPLIFVGLQCPLVRLSPFSSTRQPVRAVLAAFQLPDEDITLNIPTRTSPIYFHTPPRPPTLLRPGSTLLLPCLGQSSTPSP
ncbi:uncharacterized protein CCOS01_07918 [Colletotrichum costaricense]|uniref:Uncharacterized protein n=1 Tax=Colletotrichum costaricense TaxID=1209916 RepID=A0AAJ0E0E7_9PEZI|nr:uncharacterized protein CCOS01_07918 [Colletotrichum costaricense]KAK1527656.1 hypothetical protein CCOS01_07918 [Colletotrichum costaricense]